jgi:hypothetical protein
VKISLKLTNNAFTGGKGKPLINTKVDAEIGKVVEFIHGSLTILVVVEEA